MHANHAVRVARTWQRRESVRVRLRRLDIFPHEVGRQACKTGRPQKRDIKRVHLARPCRVLPRLRSINFAPVAETGPKAGLLRADPGCDSAAFMAERARLGVVAETVGCVVRHYTDSLSSSNDRATPAINRGLAMHSRKRLRFVSA